MTNTNSIPFIEQANALDKLENLNVSPKEKTILRNYIEDGYLIFNTECEDNFINNINDDIDKIINASNYKTNFPEYHYNESPRIVEAWRKSDNVLALARNKTIFYLLHLLYQRTPLPFSTINFVKGTAQPIHSDNIHFDTIPNRFLAGVWIALEDVDSMNGPLCIYPKSHKARTIHMHNLGLRPANRHNLKEVYTKYEEGIREFISKNNYKAKEIYLKKGQGIIWSANLLHGGKEIIDKSRTRKSQVIHFHFSGCKIYYNPLYSEPHKNIFKERDMSEHEILPPRV